MAFATPKIIVLAFGAGALGFPDALRLLIDIAGRSPLVDIGICFFAMAVVTAHALATVSLARFVRNARAGARGAAPATERFAQMTLVVSLGVAFLVSACLLVAPSAGGLGLPRLTVGFAGKIHIIEVLVAIGAAALSCSRPLLRVFHGEDNAHGAAPVARVAERFADTTQTVSLAGLFPGAVGLLVVACVVSGVLWSQGQSPLATVFVGVATVVATVLVGRFSGRARNAAGDGGGAAPPPTPAADTRRVGKLTQATFLAVVSFLVFVLATTYVPLEREYPRPA